MKKKKNNISYNNNNKIRGQNLDCFNCFQYVS